MSNKTIAKDPCNYEESEIEKKNEQAPTDISISKVVRPIMAEITTKKTSRKKKTPRKQT